MDITIVFDGAPLPSKRVTEISRQKAREESLKRARELEAAGDSSASFPFFAKSVDVTPEMAFQVAQAIRPMGVRVLVAPYEADAQLAYLSRNSLVDFIISEDSDLLVYGCKRVLYKFDYKTERGREIVWKNIFDIHPEFSRMSPTSFLITSILSGCDYLPSLNQIGIKTATSIGSRLEKFLSDQPSSCLETIVKRVIALLKLSNNFPDLNETFCDQFISAIRTFRHQVVFCLDHQQLVHLEPLSDVFDVSFLGEIYDPIIAQQVANCNIHPETKVEFSGDDCIGPPDGDTAVVLPPSRRPNCPNRRKQTVATSQPKPTHLTLMDCWNNSSKIVLSETINNISDPTFSSDLIVVDSPISIVSISDHSPPKKKIHITDLDQFAYIS